MIYIKTDNIHAAKNTALSAVAAGMEVTLQTSKKIESELWELGEVEEETLKAGDLVLKSFGKKPKVYTGEKTEMNIGEALKGCHVLRLTDKTAPMWYDYYNRRAKQIGGYTTQWAL